MIKAVIFDFDGVICKSFKIAYGVACEVHSNLSEDEYRDFFIGNIYNEEQVTEESIKKYFDLQCKRFGEIRVAEDIKRGLRKLSEDHLLFIVSSNMEETIDLVLQNSDLDEIFEARLGYESGRLKIKKFKNLLGDYKLKKEECIFVTDTLGDILEANNIGIKTIAVEYGFHDRARLERGRPMAIVKEFDELVNKINNKTDE